MSVGPLRRKSDLRPARPKLFGPTPPALGPPDRAGFVRSLDNALDAARRRHRPITLAVLTLEPAADDMGLAAVAYVVRRAVRDSDGLWRIGAASLGLLLADVDGPTAEPTLARIRLRLRDERHGSLLLGRATAAPGVDAESLIELAQADRRPISPAQ